VRGGALQVEAVLAIKPVGPDRDRDRAHPDVVAFREDDAVRLINKASKGRNGGRTVPMHRELRDTLVALKATRDVDANDRKGVSC